MSTSAVSLPTYFQSRSGGYYPQFEQFAETGLSNASADLEDAIQRYSLLTLAPVSFAVPLDVEFHSYAAEWKRESQFMSSPEQAATLLSYRRIIGMGKDVVPHMLREMRREPGLWFEALNAITGEQPIPKEHAGDIAEMTNDWLKWGEENGLI